MQFPLNWNFVYGTVAASFLLWSILLLQQFVYLLVDIKIGKRGDLGWA